MNVVTQSPEIVFELANGSRVPIAGTCSIGRSKLNTIVVAAEKASRRHAVIHRSDAGHFCLTDLGSSNGTYVNSRRLAHSMPIKDGDVVEVGGERMIFRAPSDAAGASCTEPAPRGAQLINCWMLVADTRTPTISHGQQRHHEPLKTVVSWDFAAERVIEKHGGVVSPNSGTGLFAYWVDSVEKGTGPHVLKAVRDLQRLQTRMNPEFRLAIHQGSAVAGARTQVQERPLVGSEVIFAHQLQRICWGISTSTLLSEAACVQLGLLDLAVPTGMQELDGFHGEHLLFSLPPLPTP